MQEMNLSWAQVKTKQSTFQIKKYQREAWKTLEEKQESQEIIHAKLRQMKAKKRTQRQALMRCTGGGNIHVQLAMVYFVVNQMTWSLTKTI